MSKVAYQILGCLVVGTSMFLGACAKSDGGGGGGGTPQVATTPCNSPAGGSCNPSVYGQEPNFIIPGVVNGAGYGNGYCGCSYGTMPIYNQQWGFACVPSNYLYGMNTILGYTYNTMFTAQNYASPGAITQIYMDQSPLAGQYSPNQAYGNNNYSCYGGIPQACDIRVPNTCVNGGICARIGNSANIGVCTGNVMNGGFVGGTVGGGYYASGTAYPYPYYNGGGYYSQRCRIRSHLGGFVQTKYCW